MNIRSSHLLISVLVFLLSTGCVSPPPIYGNGEIVAEDREVSGFDAVSVGGSGHLTITQGDQESLIIEADENLLPYLESVVRGSELKIRQTRNNLRFSEKPVYTVQLKNLNKLRLSGSLKAEMEQLETEDLDAAISGSGRIELGRLDAQDVDAGVSGSGEIVIGEGEAESFDARISGSGDLRAADFQVQRMSLSISGSGSGRVWVTESLDARISGSGRIDYAGSPQISSSVSGSGKIRQVPSSE
jgi:hypothetical protein